MKICIVYFSKKSTEYFKKISYQIQKELLLQNHAVDVKDGCKEDFFLTSYSYVFVGVEGDGFFKISFDNIYKNKLKQISLEGKRCFAFAKPSIKSQRVLLAFMSLLESEGALMHFSNAFSSVNQVSSFFKNFNIQN